MELSILQKNNLKKIIRAVFVSSVFLTIPLGAHADDTYNPYSKNMPVIRADDTSHLSSEDPSQYVGAINPGNNAGLLNYCVQNEYVDPATATDHLIAYNKKVGAVEENETGNMPYAQGSAGELHAHGQIYNIAMSTLPVRRNTCKAVYDRVLATLKTAHVNK